MLLAEEKHGIQPFINSLFNKLLETLGQLGDFDILIELGEQATMGFFYLFISFCQVLGVKSDICM